MSELKVHRFITTDELFPEANAGALYYDKSEADKVIAELKAENDRLTIDKRNTELRADVADAAIAELKAENHKLRRALYKACANWARSERYTEATWHGDEHREELWANVQAKCLNKAEEYK